MFPRIFILTSDEVGGGIYYIISTYDNREAADECAKWLRQNGEEVSVHSISLQSKFILEDFQ